ncbi:hypothetical protein ACFL6O_03945 [candidate division KSB1 bacterium]
MKHNLALYCLLIFIFIGCTNIPQSADVTGDYFGQEPPGDIPELFAPGIISTPEHEHSFPSFTPDGNEVLWTSVFTTMNIEFPPHILTMKRHGNIWSQPRFADFSGIYPDGEGCLSYDGSRFFFGSQRPISPNDTLKKDLDIWYVERSGSGWTAPKWLDVINTENFEMQPTLAENGNLYYVGYFEKGRNNNGIYRSRFESGAYLKPELLGENINSEEFQWTPYIAPDESYLLFSGIREGGFGSGDIYICFRQTDGMFSKPVNLGSSINTEMNERFPCVSPDGKYLFFVSDKKLYQHDENDPKKYSELVEISNSPGNGYCDIYWVDAKIVTSIKAENNIK